LETVAITLDGQEVELVPSSKAAIKLSKQYRGLLLVLDHINAGSLDAGTDVIFQALGKKDSEREALVDQVWGAGLSYLAPKLVRYIALLANGGKSPEAKASDA
jgi:hypothetical protein